ncbi:hypothetical protein [Escherichia phage IMM-001]|nr:hypothetical protein [Escherichia phage IMM-001]
MALAALITVPDTTSDTLESALSIQSAILFVNVATPPMFLAIGSNPS